MPTDTVVTPRASRLGRWLLRGAVLGAAAAGMWLAGATGASAEDPPPLPTASAVAGAVTGSAPVLDAATPVVEGVVEPVASRVVEPVASRVVEPVASRVVEPAVTR